ncbi:DUF6678 family protein [Clostridium paraputrificum]|uniref:DUF6678 family protein n=1 Tax=Clostridium paraputrificum TaxID=29363 RepID=UPI003D343597
MKEQRIEFDLEKYKKRVLQVIEKKNTYSVMNYTKWKELREAMIYELSFPPPYIRKWVVLDDVELPRFDRDVSYIGDWSYEILYPFVGIEWVKIRPRYIKPRGALIEGELVDETEELIAV